MQLPMKRLCQPSVRRMSLASLDVEQDTKPHKVHSEVHNGWAHCIVPFPGEHAPLRPMAFDIAGG